MLCKNKIKKIYGAELLTKLIYIMYNTLLRYSYICNLHNLFTM
jgi:hypothetical protein